MKFMGSELLSRVSQKTGLSERSLSVAQMKLRFGEGGFNRKQVQHIKPVSGFVRKAAAKNHISPAFPENLHVPFGRFFHSVPKGFSIGKACRM